MEAFVVALACGVVGWVTNWIAIYFLAHPREETRWLLGLRKQFGVFPRQKTAIAESVRNMLHSRLLTEDRLRQYLQSPELSQKVRDFVREGLVGILVDWFVGIEEKIRDLDKPLEPRLAEVKREIQKPEVQRFVLKKLRDLLDTVLDQRPGALMDRMPAHARREIRQALVSFL